MALADIRQGYKSLSWFNANPTLVLKEGQVVHLLQTSTYKLGDGVTALASLSFLGGGGGGTNNLYENQAWFDSNPTHVLDAGQIAFLDQTGRYKLGDGTTQLQYLNFIGSNGGVRFDTNTGGFPPVGDIEIIYVAKDTGILYQWDGVSSYTELSAGGGGTSIYDISSIRFSGKYYTVPYVGSFGSGGGYTGWYTWACPVGEAHSIDALRFRVTSGVAATTVRIALYASDSVGYPGALLLDTGDLPTDTSGDKTYSFPSALALTGRVFFISLNCTSIAVTFTLILPSGMMSLNQRVSGSTLTPQNYYTGTSGAPADPFPASQPLYESGVPLVEFKKV